LINHFIARFNHVQGKDIAGVSDEALRVLMEHDYPGNVRELENIIEHAFVLCRGGIIERGHLPPELRGPATGAPPRQRAGATLCEFEAMHILDAVRRHSGNRTAAAQELGIDPSTLFRKVKALGIELPAKDGRNKA
jgi:DNA-binding NtrC family response regulator